MYDLKKSDAVIVAVKQANNWRQRLAESVEQRIAAEEKPDGYRMRRNQSSERVSWRLTGYEKLRRETRKGVLHSECCRPSGSGYPSR